MEKATQKGIVQAANLLHNEGTTQCYMEAMRDNIARHEALFEQATTDVLIENAPQLAPELDDEAKREMRPRYYLILELEQELWKKLLGIVRTDDDTFEGA